MISTFNNRSPIAQKLSEQDLKLEKEAISKLPHYNLAGLATVIKLSQTILDSHYYHFPPGHLIIYQPLTEEFIERHLRDLDWKMINEHQSISKAFRNRIEKEDKYYNVTYNEFGEVASRSK
jgi:asparagine synthetase B (glutamine-hydrolysing)